MLSVLPSVIVLGLVAIVALLIVLNHPSAPEKPERLAAARALALAVAVQGIHFIEEAANGFHEQLPAMLALPGMPLPVFVIFNLACLAIWIASVPGVRSGRAPAFFAAWFLSIAGMFNAVAHPLLAVANGGYFPGLMTSPFIGGASVWLWLRLHSATRPRRGR